MDLKSQDLIMHIKIESGCATTSRRCGAKVYAKSGENFVWADNGWQNLGSSWIELSLDLDNPQGEKHKNNDASEIVEIGVEVATNDTGEFEAARVLIDHCSF